MNENNRYCDRRMLRGRRMPRVCALGPPLLNFASSLLKQVICSKYLDSASVGVSKSLKIDFLCAVETWLGRFGEDVSSSGGLASITSGSDRKKRLLAQFHASFVFFFFAGLFEIPECNVWYACTKFLTCTFTNNTNCIFWIYECHEYNSVQLETLYMTVSWRLKLISSKPYSHKFVFLKHCSWGSYMKNSIFKERTFFNQIIISCWQK